MSGPLRTFAAASVAWWLALSLIAAEAISQEAVSDISGDERVVFFPTIARLSDDGQAWLAPIHGWIFEPETEDFLRESALREFRERLGLEPDAESTRIFEERVRLFLVDNERGKEIVVRIAGEDYALPPSNRDGHFAGTVRVPVASAKLGPGGTMDFQAVMSRRDERTFSGVSFCLAPEGISVVSDVDDTIKISDVLDKRELIRNTFVLPFKPVEGMATAYSRWVKKGAQLHLVSASPWQLYEPLATFTGEAGFPPASFHLKPFRPKDSSFFNLLQNPITYKLAVIEPLMQSSPQRRFVLVGDSGEKDPEAYGILARRYPEQIIGIYIRDVTDEPVESRRYQEAFREIPPAKRHVFRDAAELPTSLK